MGRIKRCLLLMAVAILLTAGGVRAEPAATVKIGGTGFGLEMMRILAKAFQQIQPTVNITVFPSLGSSGGIKALQAGALDFSISGRPLAEDEKSPGLQASELYRTPFVFVTNAAVPKRSITTRELEEIYSGRLLTWADGSRIRLVLRSLTETDTEITAGLSPVMKEAVAAALDRPGMIQTITDQENLESIEKIPGALGGSSLGQILSEQRRVNILPLNGVTPSVGGVKDGRYPFSKTLYLVTRSETSPAARQFMAFIRSGKGAEILMEYGNLLVSGTRQGS
jgi:phosphate transport system substrate-binding protein